MLMAQPYLIWERGMKSRMTCRNCQKTIKCQLEPASKSSETLFGSLLTHVRLTHVGKALFSSTFH